jgi:tRNA threonylcarbamoyladenosine biosynthesis protein TsaE
MQQTATASADETVSLGTKIGALLKAGDIITLHGSLGCGKTTIVKGIARALEIEEEITSPSFTLISEYEGRLPLYHMDLYRIDSVEEFELLGAEELLYGNGVSIIEWAEKIDQLLPPSCISITFRIEHDGRRDIRIDGLQEELSQ